MGLVEKIYASAAHAGLLTACQWQPESGPAQTAMVGFAAPDQNLLDGLSRGTEYEISYPASVFSGLAARDRLDLGGSAFQVREVRAVADGSEMRATLMKV